MSLFGQCGTFLAGQAGSNEQDGIGTSQACLQQLIFVDDEIFAQDGQTGERACRAYVVQSTAEECFVCQNGQGTCSRRFVAGRDEVGLCLSVDPAFRRRAAFELGNDAGCRLGKCLLHAAAGGVICFQLLLHLFAQLLQTDGLLLCLYLCLFVLDDLR